jgi:very-short-patch-repair endonuclease
MTDAERRLWGQLRSRQVAGVKFRRQAPIGNYIVDFVSFERRLVIELDGGQHAERVEYDERRTCWLNSQGFRVLRFWNHRVFEDLEAVLEVIWRRLEESAVEPQPDQIEADEASVTPPPRPSPIKGEGG